MARDPFGHQHKQTQSCGSVHSNPFSNCVFLCVWPCLFIDMTSSGPGITCATRAFSWHKYTSGKGRPGESRAAEILLRHAAGAVSDEMRLHCVSAESDANLQFGCRQKHPKAMRAK